MLTFALADHRGEQRGGSALGQAHDLVDHLAHGLGGEIDSVVRATRNTGAREQQAQVVVDFGDGADGGARIVRCGLLLDRNRGRQPFDRVDVGLFHHGQKLARVGRQRFDVATLSFGVQSVEGQGRFSRPGQARNHYEAIAGEVDIDVFQIVGARAADSNLLHMKVLGRLS